MKGWVYVISTKSMPNLVKVGYSTKDPELRAKELYTTGTPHPYIVDYEVLVENPFQIEQQVHRHLKENREAKEWFFCSVEEAVVAIRKVVGDRQLLENYKRSDRKKIKLLEEEIERNNDRKIKIEVKLNEDMIWAKSEIINETQYLLEALGEQYPDSELYFSKKNEQKNDLEELNRVNNSKLRDYIALRREFKSNMELCTSSIEELKGELKPDYVGYWFYFKNIFSLKFLLLFCIAVLVNFYYNMSFGFSYSVGHVLVMAWGIFVPLCVVIPLLMKLIFLCSKRYSELRGNLRNTEIRMATLVAEHKIAKKEFLI